MKIRIQFFKTAKKKKMLDIDFDFLILKIRKTIDKKEICCILHLRM